MAKPLTEYFCEKKAFLFKLPVDFPMSKDPVAWAIKVASKDTFMKSTIMLNAVKGSKSTKGMMYASRGSASQGIRQKLIQSVSEGLPVQIQVDDLFKIAPEIRRFVNKVFSKKQLIQKYPCGFEIDSAMFLTGPGHIYNVHNDFDDGFLFQLHGKKHVRLWGLSPRFFKEIIFDIDFKKRPKVFFGTPRDYVLKAGYALYFPPGMLHEVSVPGPDISVSVTTRLSSVYTMVALCNDLNKLMGKGTPYYLPQNFCEWFKFKIKFFDPSRFTRGGNGKMVDLTTMPQPLHIELKKTIQTTSPRGKKCLDDLLHVWWRNLIKNRDSYSSSTILPEPPENRGEILQKWEKQRIRKSK